MKKLSFLQSLAMLGLFLGLQNMLSSVLLLPSIVIHRKLDLNLTVLAVANAAAFVGTVSLRLAHLSNAVASPALLRWRALARRPSRRAHDALLQLVARPMKPRQSITAVTFDVGGTLIEPWPSVGHVYAEMAAQWGIAEVAPEALNRGFAAAWLARKQFDHSRAAWQCLVNQTFAAADAARPSDACFGAIYRRFAQGSAWRVFEDALPTLEALATRGLRLGIISNWDERLRSLLVELDLARFFRASIISCEAGHMKPDPEIFMRAAAELGCEPAALVHVGDSARDDAEGARAAGFRAVLIDRRERRGRRGVAESAGSADGPPPYVGGYGVISSLMALPASLETASASRSLD